MSEESAAYLDELTALGAKTPEERRRPTPAQVLSAWHQVVEDLNELGIDAPQAQEIATAIYVGAIHGVVLEVDDE